ncbi:GNAT family N-acetyltransferase [Streptomyces varsoviensis]|uniref:GNAT family N-acetyltransferase n=1 Tax=Streptomyces varsoviensis TaxID=67373 RepID=UPI0033CC396C
MTHTDTALARWAVAPLLVAAPESAALLRAYLTDVADRWYELHHGRRSTAEEIERHLREMPSDDLAPPDGAFLVARHDGEPAGCVGLRRLDARTAELRRMFLHPAKRRRGGASLLLAAAEHQARTWGVHRIVLDTRLDLVEARTLYEHHGFTEIPPYSHAPHSEIWYGKPLAT